MSHFTSLTQHPAVLCKLLGQGHWAAGMPDRPPGAGRGRPGASGQSRRPVPAQTPKGPGFRPDSDLRGTVRVRAGRPMQRWARMSALTDGGAVVAEGNTCTCHLGLQMPLPLVFQHKRKTFESDGPHLANINKMFLSKRKMPYKPHKST